MLRRSLAPLAAVLLLFPVAASAAKEPRVWQKGVILRRTADAVWVTIRMGKYGSTRMAQPLTVLDIVAEDAVYTVVFHDRKATKAWEKDTQVQIAVESNKKKAHLIDDKGKEFSANVMFISAKNSFNASMAGQTPAPAPAAEGEQPFIIPPAAPPAAAAAAPSEQAGAPLTPLKFVSDPEGAEITIDGRYSGNTPSTVNLTPGEHTITISKPGYRIWKRTINVTPGSDLSVRAALERDNP